MDEARVAELAPVAVAAAQAGDQVATALLDTLAAEVASFVTAAVRRLSMTRRPVPVVLSGGVARGAGALLADRVTELVRLVAPAAIVSTLFDPPVVGAALLALDRVVPGDEAAGTRLRGAITHATLDATTGPTAADTRHPANGDDR
jgi:N-acetylglucosamine kinase-like BadF-type ATPase